MIAAAGAIAGFLLALWVSRILAAFVTAGIASPFARTAQIDLHPRPIVFAFTAAIALISAIGFGLAPAFQGSRESPLTAMKAAGPGRSGAGASHRGLSGSVLVASQATLAICLLIGAGLFLRTLINLEKLNLGFRPDHILTFMVFPLPPDVAADKAPQLVSDLQKRIAAVPGVHFVHIFQCWTMPPPS